LRVILLRGIAFGVVGGLLAVACQAAAPATPTPAPVTQNLFLVADTVQGPANLTEEESAAGAVCVQKNRFAKNEEVVWRVRVLDPATGEPMDDQALSAVTVKLPDQELAMRYGPHPRDTPVDFFWTTSFDIPESYPTGVLGYSVEAVAADGRTGTYSEFQVASAQLTVTDEVRQVIAE